MENEPEMNFIEESAAKKGDKTVKKRRSRASCSVQFVAFMGF